MNWFADPQHFASLLAELERWRGAPFIAKGRTCAGSDCAGFAAGVFQNLGVIPRFAFPSYTIRGGGEPVLKILYDQLNSIHGLKQLWTVTELFPMPKIERGNLLVISSGDALHHLAIVAEPPNLWHNLNGVTEANLMDPRVANHLHGLFEVVGPTGA